MGGLSPLMALIIIGSALVGMALGWYLRRATSWCPRCGGILTCRACGQRPARTWYGTNQRWGR
jgi:hypothetical protein